jgi:hypothetical protein
MDSTEFEKRAKNIWDKLRNSHLSLAAMADADIFSPNNLWVVQRIFENRNGEDKPGDLLFAWPGDNKSIWERDERIFNLGVYVGEIVRRSVKNYEWNCDDPRECQLFLPDDKSPLSPIKFIAEQVKDYRQGSIVEWGKKAGLKLGESPKH